MQVSEGRKIAEFAEHYHASIIDEATASVDDESGVFKENIFTQHMIDYLSELGVINGAELCHFEKRTTKGNIKTNAYEYDEDTGAANLFIAIFNGGNGLASIAKAEINNAFDQCARLFDQAIEGYHKKMEPASEQYDMMRTLYDNRQNIQSVRLFALVDGLAAPASREREERANVTFGFQIWDFQRLYRCLTSGMPYESIEIDIERRFRSPIQCLCMEKASKDYTAYLAMLPGDMIYELYDEYGSRLLELNVRSFLQAKGKVNKGIRDTLRSDPDRFLAYNNGICCTAESVDVIRAGEYIHLLKSIRGLQVVNGGQTIASIHKAGKEEKIDLKNVYVQAKITVIPNDKLMEIVPFISRFANSQNKVNDADFSSNDPYHVELQRLSETIWIPGEQSRWFYERARGQYQVAKAREGNRFEHKCPTRQKITKTDIGKFINTWDMQPHIVSLGAQKNFVHFMSRLRNKYGKEWKPDQNYYKELIGKAILFKAAEKIISSLKQDIPAYRVNIVNYTVSYIAYRTVGRINFSDIWSRQTISAALEDAIRQWSLPIYHAITNTAGQRNISEWCKKEDCWEGIRGLDLVVPAALRKELEAEQPLPTVGWAAKTGNLKVYPEDHEKIAKTMRLDADDWFNIHKWGIESGEMSQLHCGIAHTLSGYAAAGWRTVPSVKQAKQAINMLSITEAKMPSGDLRDKIRALV
jgi:hypothetical protein